MVYGENIFIQKVNNPQKKLSIPKDLNTISVINHPGDNEWDDLLNAHTAVVRKHTGKDIGKHFMEGSEYENVLCA